MRALTGLLVAALFQAVHGLAANADVRGRWHAADSPSRIDGDTLVLGRDSVRHWRFIRVR